jgi:hypothetical protein
MDFFIIKIHVEITTMGNVSSIKGRRSPYAVYPSSSPTLQTFLKAQLQDYTSFSRKQISVDTLATDGCENEKTRARFESSVKQETLRVRFFTRSSVTGISRKSTSTEVYRFTDVTEPDVTDYLSNSETANSGSNCLDVSVKTSVASFSSVSEAVAGSSEFCSRLRKILSSFQSDSPYEADLVNSLLFRLECFEEISNDEDSLKVELLNEIKHLVSSIIINPNNAAM